MATVEQIQNTAYAFSGGAIGDFRTLLYAMGSVLAMDIPTTLPPPGTVMIDESIIYNALADLLAGQPRVPILPNFGQVTAAPAPAPASFTAPTLINIPEFSLVAPTINIPAAPVIDMPTEPGEAPAINAPAIPNKPTFSLPPTPMFTPVAIPIAPAVSFPPYVNEVPVDDIVLPSHDFEYAEGVYESALLDEVKAKLLHDLINGGYGIENNDELLLWERGRERELKEAERTIQEASRQAAARGFMLPPGALFSQLNLVQENAQEKNASLSREIMLKRADLYVQNRQFTIEKSIELEKILMDFFGATAERALNVAKAGVEMAIAIFNASVARYNAKWMAYKTNAEVYEIQIKASLAALEAFKIEVDAAKIEADIQQVLANVYRIQVDGVKTLIEMYHVEMEAAKTQAEIENIKLQAYRTTVEAYTAKVQARTAEFQMFESQVRGETAKIEAFNSSVTAYNARVSAYHARTQAEKAVSDVQIAQHEAHLKRYQSLLDGYRTDVAKLSAQSQEIVSLYTAQSHHYAAVSGATAKYYDLAITLQNMNSTIYTETSRQAIDSASRSLTAFLKTVDQKILGLGHGATVLSQLAGASAHAVQGISAQTASTSA